MTGRDGTGRGPSTLTYTLPSADGAVWLGLDAAAVTALGLTLMAAALLVLHGAPVWLAPLLATAGTAVAALPIRGRTALRWLPLLAAHSTGIVLRHGTWTGTPTLRHGRATAAGRPRALQVPRGWGRLQLTDCADRTVGLVVNPRRGTVTAVLEVTGTGRFGLLDRHAQDSELSRWGTSVAALLALPDLHHLQWLTHSRPQPPPQAFAPSPPEHQPAESVREKDTALAADYADLVTRTHADALSHSHLLALTFKVTAADRVHDLLRQTATALLAADLLCCPADLARLPRLLRLQLDPALPDDPSSASSGPGRQGKQTAAGPVVLSLRSGWRSCQTDDTHHRTFALTGWPRLALPADWLAPLLHHPPEPGTARSLVVHARPVAAQHAARRARASAARARLDDADRSRLGFTAAAGTALDEADADNIQHELLAGYPMSDLSALLTLHATDPAALEISAGSLHTLSVSQRIDLRPLHGQHSQALAAALPLGHLPGGRR